KRYFLDQLRRQGAHIMLGMNGGGFGDDIHDTNWVVHVYPNALGDIYFHPKIPDSGQERDDMGLMMPCAAAYLGNASDPEIAYFHDYFDSMMHFWDFFYNHYMNQGNDDINPGIKTTGWWLWGRGADPW